MQTGVKIDHERGSQDGSPKHLRVGVNAAMCDHGALVALLVAKGVISRVEYETAAADGMEREAERYRLRLGLAANVELA
jgi:hypothetical protein